MRQLRINREKSGSAQSIKKRSPQTLLQHIEYIIELAEDSNLNDEFFKKAKTSISFVAKTMNLSLNQVVIFSLFMEKSYDNHIEVSDFSRFLGCRNIKTISMMNDIDELEKLRLIRCRKDDDGKNYYRVPKEVIESVKQSVAYEFKPEYKKNLTTDELFFQMEQLFDERENQEISFDTLIMELKSLIEDNMSLIFCRRVKEWDNIYDNDDDCTLLLLFCHRFINLDDDSIGFHNFENLYDHKWEFRNIKSNLQNGKSKLIEMNILEYTSDNRFANKEYYKIADKAKEELFAELDIKIKQSENKNGLTQHDSIVAKELFYNKREQSQIAKLTSLLQGDNFANIQKRLEDNGMRKGFACLFYGAPGTGKTETVYQIARSTDRDIMMVDISETKSCWFGESEKKIKAIFERYSAFVKTNKTMPILLFNEADAVIGKRKDSGTGNVAQTENAIQNIILQEMENLEGIMIATTNLTQNLDKAFERRFLYKIEFEKPCMDAKKMIWHSMIPSLSNSDAEELAAEYDFSGGQIENITRKRTVDCILSGTEPSLETMHEYCRNELLNKTEKRKIGFSAN
jgi:hypothetical protein